MATSSRPSGGPTSKPESTPRRDMPVSTDRPSVNARTVSPGHFVLHGRIQTAFETRNPRVAGLTGWRLCTRRCTRCGQETSLTAVAHP